MTFLSYYNTLMFLSLVSPSQIQSASQNAISLGLYASMRWIWEIIEYTWTLAFGMKVEKCTCWDNWLTGMQHSSEWLIVHSRSLLMQWCQVKSPMVVKKVTWWFLILKKKIKKKKPEYYRLLWGWSCWRRKMNVNVFLIKIDGMGLSGGRR